MAGRTIRSRTLDLENEDYEQSESPRKAKRIRLAQPPYGENYLLKVFEIFWCLCSYAFPVISLNMPIVKFYEMTLTSEDSRSRVTQSLRSEELRSRFATRISTSSFPSMVSFFTLSHVVSDA